MQSLEDVGLQTFGPCQPQGSQVNHLIAKFLDRRRVREHPHSFLAKRRKQTQLASFDVGFPAPWGDRNKVDLLAKQGHGGLGVAVCRNVIELDAAIGGSNFFHVNVATRTQAGRHVGNNTWFAACLVQQVLERFIR